MKLSINGQGHSLTLVKGHSDFKVKCLTFGQDTQVNDSGPLGPLVSHCKGDQKKTVAISQMFSHVQLHVHWMH